MIQNRNATAFIRRPANLEQFLKLTLRVCLSVVLYGFTHSATCQAAEPSFEIVGEVHCSSIEVGVTNGYHAQFRASVSGDTTLIRSRLWPKVTEHDSEYIEYYSHGSNSTLVVRHSDEPFTNTTITTSDGVEKTVTLKQPQRAWNQGTVMIRPNPLPPYGFEHVTAVWLAFGSRTHFPTTGQGSVDPVVCVEEGFRESRLKVASQWIVETHPPRLLGSMVEFCDGKTYLPGGKAEPQMLPAPYDTGFTNAMFNTTEWTNVAGLRLPLKFELLKFDPDYSTKTAKRLKVAYVMIGEAHAYFIGAPGTNLASILPNRSAIIDYRYPDTGSGTDYRSSKYHATEGKTMSAQEFLEHH